MKNINIAIVVPVYNDWESLKLLISKLDSLVAGQGVDISLIIVDDASTNDNNYSATSFSHLMAILSIEIIHLNCNLGHQRAIATGLVVAEQRTLYDAIVVMDADGEDKPEDMVALIDMYRLKGDAEIIVARRDKRSEGKTFIISYYVYKLIFRILTGLSVDFGNFCLIPKRLLKRLVYRDSLWNHLSATILRSKLPISMVSTERGERFAGVAKMNFGELVLLGLSAISVYIDKVFLRTLFFSMFLCISAVSGISVVAIIRFFTDLAIPGWASNVVGSLLVILTLSIILSIFVLFIILSNRSQISMLPAKYSNEYIQEIEPVYKK
jgi:glycosyltransferase involved in cell wall biosynthesis